MVAASNEADEDRVPSD